MYDNHNFRRVLLLVVIILVSCGPDSNQPISLIEPRQFVGRHGNTTYRLMLFKDASTTLTITSTGRKRTEPLIITGTYEQDRNVIRAWSPEEATYRDIPIERLNATTFALPSMVFSVHSEPYPIVLSEVQRR